MCLFVNGCFNSLKKYEWKEWRKEWSFQWMCCCEVLYYITYIQWNTDCEVCTNGAMEAEWFMICSESRVRPGVSALIRSELLASSAEWPGSPCHALVTAISSLRLERRLIQKSSWIKLKLLFVVVSWVKKFPLTPPWTKFLFHNIDMKWEASGIPISHNNKQAAKPSHEVLSPNRNNPRPFHIDPPGATAHSPSKWQHCTVASGLMAFVQ